MFAQSKHRLLLVCGFVLAATVVLVSQASATRVRGTGSYGQLTSPNVGVASSITGNANSFLSDADYDCQYGGTNCPIDGLEDPNTSSLCSGTSSITDRTGASPCNDLIITISPGMTFNPGSSLSITIPGFSDPTDQFGLFTCPTDPGSDQFFNGFCVSVPDPTDPTSFPPNAAACNAALQSQTPSSGGQVDIPAACLFGGASFYFDETTDNKFVSATYIPGTVPAPEPNSFMLLGVGLGSLVFLTKRLRA